ncbi:EAL domain-containing protein [Neptuniibacter sp. CAU 1671]|uniref:two-component system response regulator n=1 Tax=Neptuniibacter sp. CAU 1671 TaxID=3032593 RepID=UPI0023DC1BAC|nr:EAL domain-containing protein [Neptuniibacter sp. CAU 1671]MDF2180625.1 EAL domain-containing protein [Neptuniibacter sp. CAU 1671]
MNAERSKILMVDDNPINLRMLGRALADDFDLFIANSGEKGLQLAAEINPELILLDVMMPEIDGYEVCRRLKANEQLKQIPVVFVTALGDLQEEAKGLELGAMDYLTKPVNVNIARRRIHNLVQMERLRKNVASSEAEFRSFFEDNTSVMLLVDPAQHKIIASNAAAQTFYGYTVTGEAEISLEQISVDSTAQNDLITGSATADQRYRQTQHQLANGELRNVELYTTPVQMRGQTLLFVIVHDITEKLKAESQLKLSASVFDHAREGIMIFDANGRIIDVNDAFCQITGYSRAEALGRDSRLLRSGEHDQAFYQQLWQSLLQEGHWSGEIWNRRRNGDLYAELRTISAIRNAAGEVENYVSLFSDITQLKKQQKQLEHIAHYDALTGLPNRILLNDRLRHAMVQDARRGEHVAVIFLDLDGFKEVNDTYGHKVGDLLLMSLAYRMKHVLREGDTIARLGGDEFVAVLMDLPETENCIPLIQRLLSAVCETVSIGGNSLQVSASLGVTFYPQADEVDAEQLLRQADQAMYQAKLAGKNRYCLFDAEEDRHLRGRHRNIERIRQALQDEEFQLFYQPKVNMRTGEVIGFESLLRWMHPENGLMAPDSFLPEIEDHVTMIELGHWTLNQALMQLQTWQAMGISQPVSVNIAAYHIQQDDFVECLHTLLAQYTDVNPSLLELEVLETSALENISHVSQVIKECQALGVVISLDDFGTGYSSLAYLKLLPAEILKIDRTFVRDMLDDPEDLAILEGVIGLARAFRRRVIAEGVETAEQGEILLWLGCELAQGYGIAQPMPADRVPDWLTGWRPNPAWQGLKPIQRVSMPALFAVVEYRAWVVQVSRFLESQQAELGLSADPSENWAVQRAGEGETPIELPEGLQAACRVISQSASELIARKDAAEQSVCESQIDALLQSREQLLNHVRNWVVH